MFPTRLKQLLRLENILITVLLITIGALVFQATRFNAEGLTESLITSVLPGNLLAGVGSGSFISQKELGLTGSILLPAGYTFNISDVRAHLQNTASVDWPWVQVKKNDVVDVGPIVESQYMNHEAFPLFHSADDSDQCDSKLNLTVDSVEVGSRVTIPGNFRHILEKIVEEHDIYHDEYYNDIGPLFFKHLRVQLETNMINMFWFRLSGSSVWLKDHNVHLVVSRFMFSPRSDRQGAKMSLALAQIFDKDWKEVKDIRLVFPVNDLELPDPTLFKVGNQWFQLYRFPRILPTPFHHDYGTTGDNFFGPEDPRITLVRNARGYDEPMMVYNAVYYKDGTNEEGKPEEQKIRSMFMSFPFQLQKGKYLTEFKPNPRAENATFSRTVELSIANRKKEDKNKNWTPLISDILRHTEGGHDRYVYFASKLENLEILKCDITSNSGICFPVYSMGGGVGPLRGGTPFININTLLREQTDVALTDILPPGREVFVAFARAHLSGCGCGAAFYRPNLIVITKDQATYTRSNGKEFEAVTEYFYKISHCSASISLHVPIDPWYVDRPFERCAGVNAVIPNGISTWKINSLKAVDGRWKASDAMTLAFSVSDFTVDRVNLQGILDTILNTADQSIFLPPQSPDSDRRKSFVSVPKVDFDGKLQNKIFGFSNRNIDCAMGKSRDFCKAYGEEQKIVEKEHEHDNIEEAKQEFNAKLHDFETALKGAPNEALKRFLVDYRV